MSYDYLNKNKANGSNGSEKGSAKRTFDPGAGPDRTLHTPPIVFFLLGGLMVIVGFMANGWQIVTTFTGFWSLFNPPGTPINYAKQPIVFIICAMMATAAQIGLALIVWRIDTRWKNNAFAFEKKADRLVHTAVEVVQQVDLVQIYAGLSFIVDTVGDYTFIVIYTASLDPGTQAFLIFLYAAFLYSLSTIVFVRGCEYLAAGWVTSRNLAKEA